MEVVKAHDATGQEIGITREDRRTGVLPHTLRLAWDDPEKLFSALVGALRDGLSNGWR